MWGYFTLTQSTTLFPPSHHPSSRSSPCPRCVRNRFPIASLTLRVNLLVVGERGDSAPSGGACCVRSDEPTAGLVGSSWPPSSSSSP